MDINKIKCSNRNIFILFTSFILGFISAYCMIKSAMSGTIFCYLDAIGIVTIFLALTLRHYIEYKEEEF